MREAATGIYRQAVTLTAELVKSYMWVGKGTVTSVLDEQLQPGAGLFQATQGLEKLLFV